MKKATLVLLGLVVVAGIFTTRDRHRYRVAGGRRTVPPPTFSSRSGRACGGAERAVRTVADEAERVRAIKRDYGEIRAQALQAYGGAGADFPGGQDAFERQLALLARDEEADLAAALPSRALEDLELRESAAGQLVNRVLGPTGATEEQRRAVFRLQHGFEEEYEQPFDPSARGAWERERARQAVQDQIGATLGESLFETWLAGTSADYAATAASASEHGLAAGAALMLQREKNDYVLRRLELDASGRSPAELQSGRSALVRQAEARTALVIGPGLFATARAELVGWLPKP